MTTIKADYGANASDLRPDQDSQPSLASTLRDVADDLESVLQPGSGTLRSGGVITNILLDDPTTGSSQLTGTGNTTWNVNVAAFECVVGDTYKVFAAAADFSIHASSFLTGLVNGASCMAAIVAKNVSGTVTTVAVKGTPATTGSEVAPTDTEIQTALGATVPWIKIGECTLNRTGDTTVTETHDNSFLEPYVRRNYTLKTIKG